MCATAQIENSAQLPPMLDHRTFPEHRQLLQARQRWILETERRDFQPKNLRGGGKREEEKEESPRGNYASGYEWILGSDGHMRRQLTTPVPCAQGRRQALQNCFHFHIFTCNHVSIILFTFTFISYKKRLQLQCQSANLRARSCSPLLQSMARLIGRPDTSSTDAFIIASLPPTCFFFVPCKSQAVYFLRRVVEVSL